MMWAVAFASFVGCGRSPQKVASPAINAENVMKVDSVDEVTAKYAKSIRLLVNQETLKHNPAALDIPGDPNMRPIRFWFVDEGQRTSKVYLLGHADGPCCRLVSGAVLDAATEELSSSWFSFGVSVLQARSRGASPLDGFRTRIEQLQNEPVCAGQIHIETHTEDVLGEAAESLAATATKAYKSASMHGRPMLVWHEAHESEIPIFAPVLVPHRRGDKLEPLVVELEEKDFAFPEQLTAHVSLGGLGQYVASIRADLEKMQELKELAPVARAFADGYIQGNMLSQKVRINYRDTGIENEIRGALPDLEYALKMNVASIEIFKVFFRDQPLSMQAGVAESNETIKRLKESIRRNKEALRQLENLPTTPTSQPIILKYSWLVPKPASDNQIQIFATWLGEQNFDLRIAELRRELGRAQKLVEHPPPDPFPSLVDATLRGWPATFSNQEAEDVFDEWIHDRQDPLWRDIRKALDKRGIDLGGGQSPMGVLHASNVVYRVEHKRRRIRVTPYFVLAGSFYQVVDPGAGLVRYESPAADQNLESLENN